jgi:hypothetical protein
MKYVHVCSRMLTYATRLLYSAEVRPQLLYDLSVCLCVCVCVCVCLSLSLSAHGTHAAHIAESGKESAQIVSLISEDF